MSYVKYKKKKQSLIGQQTCGDCGLGRKARMKKRMIMSMRMSESQGEEDEGEHELQHE